MTNRIHLFASASGELVVEHIDARGNIARRPGPFGGTLIQETFPFEDTTDSKREAGQKAARYIHAAQSAVLAIGFELPLYAQSAQEDDAEFKLVTGDVYYGVEDLIWPFFF